MICFLGDEDEEKDESQKACEQLDDQLVSLDKMLTAQYQEMCSLEDLIEEVLAKKDGAIDPEDIEARGLLSPRPGTAGSRAFSPREEARPPTASSLAHSSRLPSALRSRSTSAHTETETGRRSRTASH